MNKKTLVVLALCGLTLASCSKPAEKYINEAKSKTVEARAGQEYERYAVYNPEISAGAGIEFEDVEYAAGTFRLINPTNDKLESLSGMEQVTLYCNQLGQVIVEVKGR